MTSQEMMKAAAGPGNWFVNVAELGQAPNWVVQRKPDDVPLNGPATLFGYDQRSFMARQYR